MLVLLRLYARMPLRLLHALGAAMGWVVYGLSPSYRRRLKENAGRAGVGLAQQRAAVAQAGRMAAEVPWLWLAPADRPISSRVRWQGREVLEQALQAGRGVVILTPHLGSFEVLGQAYAEAYGARAPMTALYRPARKALLRQLEETSRHRPGLLTAPANLAGVRQIIRALRRGQTTCLLPDQVPPQGQGVWAPFFGAPAYTMTLAWRLLEQSGAQPVLAWCERLPQSRGWVLHLMRPKDVLPQSLDPSADETDSAAEMPSPALTEVQGAAQINEWMQALVRMCPSQYLWGYHRYKQPRGADTPNAAQEAAA